MDLQQRVTLPAMALGRCSFRLKFEESVLFPPYKGATFRGGFGYAFKRVACVARGEDCAPCQLKNQCVYAYVFETPVPPSSKIMRKYPSAPHPYVMIPSLTSQRQFPVGSEMTVDVVLVGKAIPHLPYFIHCFEELGKLGLTQTRSRYRLCDVSVPTDGGDRKIVYSGEEKVLSDGLPVMRSEDFVAPAKMVISKIDLHLLTPLRLKFEEQLAKEIPFHAFFRNLMRRIVLLSTFHCGGDPDLIDFRGLIDRAKAVKTSFSRLQWYDWDRYSTRQQAHMTLGGWLGEIGYEGELSEFLPWLLLGEILHVGKGTSFGLGRYEIMANGSGGNRGT